MPTIARDVLFFATSLVVAVLLLSMSNTTTPRHRPKGESARRTVKLYTGIEIPLVGLGTWKSKPGEVKRAVEHAIDVGYRHIDCAYIYGNEREIGEAFKTKIGTTIERKDIFVTSKLWNTRHHPDDVRPSLQESLDRLQLDYIDLYLIHWPTGFERGEALFPRNEDGTVRYDTTHYMDTWREMEKLVDDGLVKHIGLSNFNARQTREVHEKSRIKPAVLQCESHPYLTQARLVDVCRELNVVFEAYSPLGSPDRPWAKPGEPALLLDPKLDAVAKKYGKSPAQVLIRYQIERDLVVLPKSVTPSRIEENFQVWDFELSDEDLATVESFDRNWRACLPKIKNAKGEEVPRDVAHPYYPFGDPF
ncbi:aldo-keto reductase family 1 member A1-like [Oscarella lobularis]|uniref:aldo-keto reductase family 1 member A1-like n=1 Tax=Oscarella lobularis TaxID=121494 RepID=UPI003313BAF5